MNPLKKLAGQTAIYGLPSIVGRLLNYLLVPLHTRYMEPSVYGVVSELYAWVAFLLVLLTFGMETSLFRFLSVKENKEEVFNNSFLTVIGINLLFFFAVLFANQPIADAMLYSDHNEYIILLAMIVSVDAISAMQMAKLRAQERAKKFALIQICNIAVNISLNLILMLFVFDSARPEEGVLFILIANLLASLTKPLLLYKDYLQLKLRYNAELGKEMLKYAYPLVIAGFAGIVNETLDRILLKHVSIASGKSVKDAMFQVGVYSANYKLAMMVSIMLQAYRYAAEPFFFNLAKGDENKNVYGKVMNYFVGIVCLMFLLVSLNIDVLRYFIPNRTYWTGLDVVPLLLLANVFLGIYFNQSIWYKLSGQTKFGAFIALGGAFLTIVLNIMLIPEYGYYACAVVTMTVYLIQMIASYLLGQKYYPIKYNLRKFFLYFGTSLLVFFIAGWMPFETGSWGKFFFNNFMIVLYIGIFLFIERAPRSSKI